MADIPALQAPLCHFGMKLKGEREVPHCKCLILVEHRTSQKLRAVWQIERIPVPVQHSQIVGE